MKTPKTDPKVAEMQIDALEEMAAEVAGKSGRSVFESRHAIRVLAVGLALTMGGVGAESLAFYMQQHQITGGQALAALSQAVGL